MSKNKAQSRNCIPRIMVVDNSEITLTSIKFGLEEKSFKVDIFSTTEAALDSFELHAPDYYKLVLTDIRMPKMNGFALYLHLKEKNPSMKIIFTTTYDIKLDELKDIFPAIEIDEIIKKPFDIDDLVMQIKHILES